MMTALIHNKPKNQTIFLLSGEGLCFYSVALTCVYLVLILLNRQESLVVVGSVASIILMFLYRSYNHWKKRMCDKHPTALNDSIMSLLLSGAMVCSVCTFFASASTIFWFIDSGYSTQLVMSEVQKIIIAVTSFLALISGVIALVRMRETHDN